MSTVWWDISLLQFLAGQAQVPGAPSRMCLFPPHPDGARRGSALAKHFRNRRRPRPARSGRSSRVTNCSLGQTWFQCFEALRHSTQPTQRARWERAAKLPSSFAKMKLRPARDAGCSGTPTRSPHSSSFGSDDLGPDHFQSGGPPQILLEFAKREAPASVPGRTIFCRSSARGYWPVRPVLARRSDPTNVRPNPVSAAPLHKFRV